MSSFHHTACSILINTPITYAYQNLWNLLFEENKWTEGSNIQKKKADLIHRNVTTLDIDVKQIVKKDLKDKKIVFSNESGNLSGDYFYQLEQNGKGEVILNYFSSAMRNGLAWPPKFAIEEELLVIKNELEMKHHGPVHKKKGLCC